MIHIMSNYICYGKKKKLRFFFLLGINLGKHFVFVWLEFGENKKVMGFLQFKSGKKN